MKKFLFALALPALLASCAPSVMGTQAFNPVLLETPLSSVRVAPGQTVFVQVKYPRGLVGMSQRWFTPIIIDFDQRVGTGNVTSPEATADWLTMTASDLPKGVNVQLVQARLVKDIRTTTDGPTSDRGSSTQVSFAEVVRVILKVTAMSDAQLGLELAKLNFGGRDVEGSTILSVSVEK